MSEPSASSPNARSLSALELTPTFWEDRYQEGTTPWDLGQSAPPFVRLLQSAQAPLPGRIAVLGSGRGHDALLFAEHGFEVVGFDYAPSAVVAATEMARSRGLTAQFLERDIFQLEEAWVHRFDYVLEHTCFCAIAPDLRPAYAQLVHRLLRPQGELIALFWAHARPGGPPFGATSEEIRRYFSADFDLVAFEPVPDSIDRRQNEEFLARFRAR